MADAFGLLFRAIGCLLFGLVVALACSVGGCVYMRAHFEADLKKLREANKDRHEREDDLKPLTVEEFERLQDEIRKDMERRRAKAAPAI